MAKTPLGYMADYFNRLLRFEAFEKRPNWAKGGVFQRSRFIDNQ